MADSHVEEHTAHRRSHSARGGATCNHPRDSATGQKNTATGCTPCDHEQKIFSKKNSEKISGKKNSEKIIFPEKNSRNIPENFSGNPNRVPNREVPVPNKRGPAGTQSGSAGVLEIKTAEDITLDLTDPLLNMQQDSSVTPWGEMQPNSSNGFGAEDWGAVFEFAKRSQQSSRDRRAGRARPQRRRRSPVQRVMLSGIDDVPHHVIISRLSRLGIGLEKGQITLKSSKVGTGIIMSHREASKLLEVDIDDKLFGRSYRFTVTPVDAQTLTLYVSRLPENLDNNDLLEAIPGVYRIRRLPRDQTKAFVHVINDEARALLLRDGVSVQSHPLVFEVPKPHVCRSCLSTEHRHCTKKRCTQCGSHNHLSAHCLEDTLCMFCDSNQHTIYRCPDYKKWQNNKQKEEEERLLALIPSFEEALEDPRPIHPILTTRQQRIYDEGHSKSGMSFADIVASRLTQRKKKQSKKTQHKKPKDDHKECKPAPSDVQPPPNVRLRPSPLDAVMHALDTSKIDASLMPLVTAKLETVLQDNIAAWISTMTTELQKSCDEFADSQHELLKHELTEHHAQHLGSGRWTIHCECGSRFHATQAEQHLMICPLEQKQSRSKSKKRSRSKELNLSPLPLPSPNVAVQPVMNKTKQVQTPDGQDKMTEDSRNDTSMEEDTKTNATMDEDPVNDDDDDALTHDTPATPHKRPAPHDRVTPEQVRQMKLTTCFDRLSSTVTTLSDAPAPLTTSVRKPRSSSCLAGRRQ